MNDVIKYVDKNYDMIAPAMILSNKEDKKRKQKSKEDKIKKEMGVKLNKKGITVNAERKIIRDEVKIILSFD